MPFESTAQQGWMFANEPAMAKRWAAHTPDMKNLPEHVGDKGKSKEKKGSAMNAVSELVKRSADLMLVEKLAEASNLSPEAICNLAALVKLEPATFVKKAFADPKDYVLFLQQVSGAVKPAMMTKQAISAKGTLTSMLGGLQSAGKGILGAGRAAVGDSGTTLKPGGMFGESAPVGGTGLDRLLAKTTFGGSRAGRIGTAVGGPPALGVSGAGIASMMSGAKPPPPPGAPAASPAGQAGGVGGAAPGAAVGASPASPAAGGGGAAGGAPGAEAGGGKGMPFSLKALLAAGGVGAGGLGVHQLLKRRRRNQDREVTAADMATEFLRGVILKKATALYRKQAADQFCSYLDKVAAKLPLEKTAQVRLLQSAVAAGKDLSGAIKLAYPQLNGEQRGILASQMVRGAVGHTKAAREEMKTITRTEGEVKLKDRGAGKKMKAMANGTC